jgi:hypothetical protein
LTALASDVFDTFERAMALLHDRESAGRPYY